MYAADIDVSPAQAAELIARCFPALAGLGVEPFGSGMDNYAFLAGGRWVFRFPRRSKIAELLAREAQILPLLADGLPVRITAPVFVAQPQPDFPWLFAGYPIIAGATAMSQRLDDAQRAALAPQLGAFLRALHALDPAEARRRGLPGDEIGRMDPQRRIPMVRERLDDLVACGAIADARPLLRILLEDAPLAPPPGRAIVHGDLYAAHVVLDGGALAGVIDWGDVHFGDPSVDLAVAHQELPAAAHATFRAAYGEISEATWRVARWRAVVHGSLIAHFGRAVGNRDLLTAGLWSLAQLAG